MGFLINFMDGDSYPHKHKKYEIIFCTKGNGTIYLSKKTVAISSGMFVIIPPGFTHYSLGLDADYERIYINGDFDQMFYATSPTVIMDNSENDGLTLIKMIYRNQSSNYAYLSSLINALSNFLLQNLKMKNDLFVVVKNIIEEINSNFCNCNISLNTILKKSGYAEDYIRAHFKNITGKTPTEFLNETRIKHACYMIDIYSDSVPLTNIAEKCGYLDYVYFSRKFKQIMGISPSKYSKEITDKTS